MVAVPLVVWTMEALSVLKSALRIRSSDLNDSILDWPSKGILVSCLALPALPVGEPTSDYYSRKHRDVFSCQAKMLLRIFWKVLGSWTLAKWLWFMLHISLHPQFSSWSSGLLSVCDQWVSISIWATTMWNYRQLWCKDCQVLFRDFGGGVFWSSYVVILLSCSWGKIG